MEGLQGLVHCTGNLRRAYGEQVGVEVAGRCGEVAHPLQIHRQAAHHFSRQGIAEELQRRPGPTHRHPQIMQELRVEVGHYPWHVEFCRVEQLPHQGLDRGPGRHRRLQPQVDPAGVVAGPATNLSQRAAKPPS